MVFLATIGEARGSGEPTERLQGPKILASLCQPIEVIWSRLRGAVAEIDTFEGPGSRRMLVTKGEHAMPADKLGRFMTSPEFLERAKTAVARAVRELETKGIRPVYLDRDAGRIVGGSDDASRANDSCEGPRPPDILNGEDLVQGAKQ